MSKINVTSFHPRTPDRGAGSAAGLDARRCDAPRPNPPTGGVLGWKLTISVVMVLFLGGWAAVGRARVAGKHWTVYKNKSFHFRFLVPKGWGINDQRTHPTILMTARSPGGAMVKVAVKVMRARITLMAFARSEKKALAKLGYHTTPLKKAKVGTLAALKISGKHLKKNQDYRLFFFQKGRVGFVLTLTYPRKQAKKLERLFELVLRSFTFTK